MSKRKSPNKPLGSCPANDCSGGSPGRQSTLTEGQRDKLDSETLKRAEAAGTTLYRCSYCGAVYDRWANGGVLGHLDNYIIGEGWHPSLTARP